MVNPADLDPRFVNLTGDTMTGVLAVQKDGTTGASSIQINNHSSDSPVKSALTFRSTRGTKAAQTPCAASDYVGRLLFYTVDTAAVARESAIDCFVVGAPTATGVETTYSFAVSTPEGSQFVPLFLTKGGPKVYGTLAVNSANPTSEAALAKLVLVGNAGQSAGTLAETNTKALVSIRPNSSSGFTLAIGSTLPGNNPYLQGVNFNGGASTAPFAINPYGGSVAIGTSAISSYALDVVGITRVSTATGNGFTVVSTAGGANAAGVVIDMTGATATNTAALFLNGGPAASATNYAIYCTNPAKTYIQGSVGIGWGNPTGALEVAGAVKFRNALEVVGNITSAGTAHNFAAKSIPASAINGLTSGATAANDLTDVTVNTPTVGQVLRFDGTNFVNAKLNFSDLSGTQTNPTINAPSIFKVFPLADGQAEARKDCVLLPLAPVASATITGLQGYYFSNGGYTLPTVALVLGKFNNVTKVFSGGIATYSGWVSMTLSADERHACVFPSNPSGNPAGNTYYIRYYTATENSNWSTGVAATFA